MIDPALRSLDETGWLAATPEPFRTSVLAACRLRTFARGETVYGFDDPPGGLWGVASGTIAIEIASAEHGLHVAHLLHPGAWIGEAALVARTARRVGAVATRPSTLAFMPLAELDRILAAEPGNWRWLALLAVLHTDIAVAVANDLMIRQTTARVAAILLHLAGCRDGKCQAAAEIEVSQSDLARMCALSRTAFAGQLKRLRELGLIEADYRRIRIVSPARLKAHLEASLDRLPEAQA